MPKSDLGLGRASARQVNGTTFPDDRILCAGQWSKSLMPASCGASCVVGHWAVRDIPLASPSALLMRPAQAPVCPSGRSSDPGLVGQRQFSAYLRWLEKYFLPAQASHASCMRRPSIYLSSCSMVNVAPVMRSCTAQVGVLMENLNQLTGWRVPVSSISRAWSRGLLITAMMGSAKCQRVFKVVAGGWRKNGHGGAAPLPGGGAIP